MKNSDLAFALLASAGFVHAPAFAQDRTSAATDAEVGVQDIIVTAQRREESLQNVPVAVTALNSDTLQKARITNVQTLSGFAPNLQVANQVLQSTSAITIRGVTSALQSSSADPKVGIYVDGVYLGRVVGSIFDLADIARIEVLRGPQGTLFGRNATSGAINIVTAAPSGELGGNASISYGNSEALRGKITLNLPKFGPFSAKLSYLHDEIEGDVTNLVGGQTLDLRNIDPSLGTVTFANKLGSRNIDGFQVAVHADLGSITADYRFDRTDSRSTGRGVQSFGVQNAGLNAIIVQQAALGGITNISQNRLSAVANATSEEHVVNQGHSLTLNLEASDALNIKSITAYRKVRQDPTVWDTSSSGGLRSPVATGPNDRFYSFLAARQVRQRQFSQELQLQLTQDAFELTAGGFYFHERGPEVILFTSFLTVINGVAPGVVPTRTIPVNSSKAGYGQLTVHITDKLDLTGGLRYTDDRRKTNLISASGASGPLAVGRYEVSYSKWNYTGIVTYRPSDAVTSYAKIASGYVAGGLSNGVPYKPESLLSYELGLKAKLFDNRVRANFAAFRSNYDDLQVQDLNRTTGLSFYGNAGKAIIKGFEAEVDIVPIAGLTLNGSVGYSDFKYKTYVQYGVDIASIARTPYVSKWTGRLAGEYQFPEMASGGNPYVRLDSRYRSKAPLTTTAINFFNGDTSLDKLAYTKAHWIVDGRVGVASLPLGNVKASVSLYGQNILDKRVYSFGAPVFQLTTSFDRGRTYGLEFEVEF